MLVYLIRGVFELVLFCLTVLFVLYSLYFILNFFGKGFAKYVKMVIDKIHEPAEKILQFISGKLRKKRTRRKRRKKFKLSTGGEL